MPAEPPRKRQLGLAGVHKAREMRVAGKFSRPTEKMWLGAAAGVIVLLAGYMYVSGRALRGEKEVLLGKRNAVEVTLGAEWTPLRDKIEKLTLEEALDPYKGDRVDESTKSLSFRSVPGIYLRLIRDDARDVTTLRKAAEGSLKDAFSACLLRTSNEPLAKGEVDAAVFPEQPWNLRQAYASTRILTDTWKHEVDEASDPLRLRVFQQQYDKAIAEEIPLAIDIVKRARFLLLVLDEDSAEAEHTEGGKVSAEALQLVSHDARVVVFDLKRDAVIARLRRVAAGGFAPVGDRPISDPETRDAVQRQVNNCALAQAVVRGIAGSGGN